jgi:glycosyltransferase involved in cell wall biosynthesis
MIADFQPDILHVHYASSYGLIGALSGFHPYLVSVWGADIFEFPRKSIFHRELIKFTLRKADKILSTSHVMAKETNKYTEKPIEVTPFGIDLDRFKPFHAESLFNEDDIVIGTIKGLDKQYGIEFLLQAFAILAKRQPALPLKLLIVGGGPLEKSLKQRANELGIENRTAFTGQVRYDEIASYHNMLTIFVALSVIDSESFGVAILEASACEKPVVVANVGGLPEVVEHGVTGLVVPPKHPEAAAAAIERLIHDNELRWQMGNAGRERVKKLYDWKVNVEQMLGIYRDVAR